MIVVDVCLKLVMIRLKNASEMLILIFEFMVKKCLEELEIMKFIYKKVISIEISGLNEFRRKHKIFF